MKNYSLRSFLHPGSVAVVGVSEKEHKLGSIVLKNIIDGGFQGNIYGVNPKLAGQKLMGVDCYAELHDIPGDVEMAIVVVPSRFVLDVAGDAVKEGIKSMVVISAGFAEVGNNALEQDLIQICKDGNVRLLGPNCLGAILPHAQLNASFSEGMPDAGSIAFISQSGAFCTAALDYAQGKNIHFSHFISLGNKADIDELDLLKAFEADDSVEAIALYLESIHDGKAWINAIRDCSKPVVVLEPGVSVAAQAASLSHTGSLAPSSEILKEAYRHAGAVQVWTMQEMFTVLELITASRDRRRGKNIAILTNAGGVGVLSSDLVEAEELHLPAPIDFVAEMLKANLPAEAGFGNPYDIIGDAPAERYKVGLEALIQDPNIDQILVLLTPQKTTQVLETAHIIAEVSSRTDKAIVASFIGGPTVAPGIEYLQKQGIVTSHFPSVLLRGMGLLSRAHKPVNVVTDTPSPNPEVTTILEAASAQDLTSVPQNDVRKIGALCNMPLPKGEVFTDYDTAIAFFESIPHPAVLKLSAPDALHKTELKGVHLNINSLDEFAGAWYALTRAIQSARLEGAGIEVQQQIPNGTEVIIGMKRDETFGPVMVFGAGGIYSEVWHDTSVTLLPVGDFEATFARTKVGKILTGVRGQEGADIGELLLLLKALQDLFLTQPLLQSVDLNPVIAEGKNIWCVDIKLVLKDH